MLNNALVSINYFKDIGHWASSSSEDASCSVEPGTAADVGKIVSTVHVIGPTMFEVAEVTLNSSKF